jgi:hypothetical protein
MAAAFVLPKELEQAYRPVLGSVAGWGVVSCRAQGCTQLFKFRLRPDGSLFPGTINRLFQHAAAHELQLISGSAL